MYTETSFQPLHTNLKLFSHNLIELDGSFPTNNNNSNEIALLKQQVALLQQSSDPYHVVELAIKIAIEQDKVKKAMKARDAAVERLKNAYTLIEQHQSQANRIEPLETFAKSSANEDVESAQVNKTNTETVVLKKLVEELREEIKAMKGGLMVDTMLSKNELPKTVADPMMDSPPLSGLEISAESFDRTNRDPPEAVPDLEEDKDVNSTLIKPSTTSEEAVDIINARNNLLAALPLPEEAPDEVLRPIIIPTPYVNLYEFLASVPGPLGASLSNYRILDQLTTSWCPQREEHGYYLTPLFKCITHPRVTTAHQWVTDDVMSEICEPTECFYNKDGVWYYAGMYEAFRLDDLTVKEWEALSIETTQTLIKQTLQGRKNTSPQNTYEATQLYAVGALKVAVIALRCVGFNREMYRVLVEHAGKCTLSTLSALSAGTATAEKEEEMRNGNVTPALGLSHHAKNNSLEESRGVSGFGIGTANVNVNRNMGVVDSSSSPTSRGSNGSGYSFGLGLGLGLGFGFGSGNIWNTNLGVGIGVGNAGKNIAGKSVGQVNSAIKGNTVIKPSAPSKVAAVAEGVRDENDPPPAIVSTM